MEGVGSEVSQKIRSAIKAKLVELGTYVDEELPDYIMVLVANNKTKDQMDDDLSLFLGHNTEPFTSWLHHVLQKLNAASMLKPPAPAVEEQPKKKEEKKKAAPVIEKQVEIEEKVQGRKGRTARTPAASKQKPEKEKKEKKGKKVESKLESPLSTDILETIEKTSPKEGKKVKDKEKEKSKPPPTLDRSKRNRLPTPPMPEVVTEKEKSPPVEKKTVRGRRGASKISSAEIFRAETSTADDQPQAKEEEEQVADDVVEFTADMDELDLELEDEPAPKKLKTSKDGVKEHRKSKEAKVKSKSSSRKSSRDTTESEKDNVKEKGPVKQKVSVLDRLGASVNGNDSRRLINLREESSFPPKPSKDAPGMARAVSSAITMAVSSTSGKRHDSRVRSTSRESSRSSALMDDRRTTSGRRVVSTVGAVLRRLSASKDEDEEEDEEEYDPKKPQLSGLASKVEVAPRPKRPGSIQANTSLILRAMADAHKSTNRSHRHRIERGPDRDEPPPPKKQKGELFTKSYREREQSRHSRDIRADEDEIRVRKIAITVPNSIQSKNDNKSSSIVKHETKRSVEKEKPRELLKSITSSKTLTDEEREEQELLQAVVNSRKGRTAGHYKVSEDILVVEEEEEEEEMIDETMEDELPSIPAPKAITLSNYAANASGKISGERTRFIVTLEGVDQADYRSNERVDLRSRLGPIPSRQLVEQESMEEVEEYIEEVEEWEEEEEMEDEMLCSSEAVPGSAHLQSRLKVPAPIKSAPVTSTKLERCRFWPTCTQGESCLYHHPIKPCTVFPACTYGEKCLFIHPNCRYDGVCTKKECPFTHVSARHIPPAAAAAAARSTGSVHYSSKPITATSRVKCRFFPSCNNMQCPFMHPTMCRYGATCTTFGCSFAHPKITTGTKLKWIAPKSTAATTTATTVKSTIIAKT